jgi:hypothetical protein
MVVVSVTARRWAVGPYSAASSGSVHGSGGIGAANRSSPTGGRAYGIPRKRKPPSALRSPRTGPHAVVTW